MRILVTFIGGLGHLEPLLPLARAAAAAGHEVAVAGSGNVVGRVTDFRTFPTSVPRPRPAEPPGRDLTPLEVTGARSAEVEFAQNFADKGARRHAVAVGTVLDEWRPDVVVRDEADLGTALACELRSTPCAVVLVLAAGQLIKPDLVGPPLAVLRSELALPPDPDLAMLTRDVVLAPQPSSFRDPASPVALPGPTCWFRPHAPVVAPAARSARPRVYATLGTVFNNGSGDLLDRMLAGLSEVGADVLLTVGRDIDPADLGPRPDHVRVERFVPQAEVLGSTDLVVSHGGSGSLLAALAHGVPSVLLPLGADQPHNAARAVELGVALALDAAAASAADIADAATSALADRPLAVAARGLADEWAAQPGVDEAAKILYSLA